MFGGVDWKPQTSNKEVNKLGPITHHAEAHDVGSIRILFSPPPPIQKPIQPATRTNHIRHPHHRSNVIITPKQTIT
jgi:hypothetical protein